MVKYMVQSCSKYKTIFFPGQKSVSHVLVMSRVNLFPYVCIDFFFVIFQGSVGYLLVRFFFFLREKTKSYFSVSVLVTVMSNVYSLLIICALVCRLYCPG